MPLNINDLPYEIFSTILEVAAAINSRDVPRYTYGLSQAPEPMRDPPIQRFIRGQASPGVIRWNASKSIRQVGRKWHDWAISYALKDLHISRWRGSERWAQLYTLNPFNEPPSSFAVYQDPYCSLKKTLHLFDSCNSLASCVRKIWFHGYDTAKTNAMIFRVLRHCDNLDVVTLPWTAVRYGHPLAWSHVLGRNIRGQSISSLEFLAVNLKQSQKSDPDDQFDLKPLRSPLVNFSGLRRLKIFGHSDFMPLTDDDLIAISRTASNLREIHITGTSTTSIVGMSALINSSNKTLEVLEHTPLTADGFDHPDPMESPSLQDHLCPTILHCHKLRDLSISMPSVCENFFADYSVNWSGDLQIRTGTVCGGHPDSLKTSGAVRAQFWRVLNQARRLMFSRKQAGSSLNVEIFVGDWIFEPRHHRVHGDFQVPDLLSAGAWPEDKVPSLKGPYGQTGLYGKYGSYDHISEGSFKEGLRKGYVSFSAL
ncbi:hypothetical protein ACLMJK_003521 [Lecanora helva]